MNILEHIPTKIAAAIVPSRTPATVCKHAIDIINAMTTNGESHIIFIVLNLILLTIHTACTNPSPAKVTMFATTSKLTPIPTKIIFFRTMPVK